MLEPWEHGTAVRCTRLPNFWNYNSLRVEGRDSGAIADALVHAADVLQGGLEHRQIEVEDEAAGARLRPGFEALGWAAERLAWMRLQGLARGTHAVAVEEAPFAGTRRLRRQWARASFPRQDDAAIEQLADMEEEVADLRGARAVVARDVEGTPAGFASFVAQYDAAEVEQAYVAPALRGQGVGGALVAAAVEAAGASETFIVADDEGASKRLYARLGFEPVWLQHVFTRRPG